MFILDVISTCAAQARLLSNPKEIISIFLFILESNDPIAKALTIRAVGILSCISHDSLEFQYLLIRGLKDAKCSVIDANQALLNATAFSSCQIAHRDERFAAKLCDLIFSDKVPHIPELCNAFKCLNSILNIVKGMKQILDLLNTKNILIEMRPFLYKSRALLAHRSIIYVSGHIDYIIDQIKNESENTCFYIYECLVYLSKKAACSFSIKNIREIICHINSKIISGRCVARGAEALFNIISSQTYSANQLVECMKTELNYFLEFTVSSILKENFQYCRYIIFFANEVLQINPQLLYIGKFPYILIILVQPWMNLITSSINKGLGTRLHYDLLWSFTTVFPSHAIIEIDTFILSRRYKN